MKLEQNTTDIPNHFVKKMMSWVCRQVEISPKEVRYMNLKNTKFSFSGTAWRSGCVVLRVGPESRYPTRPYYHNGVPHWFENRIQGLVFVAAHEAVHLWQFQRERKAWHRPKRDADRERQPDSIAVRVLLEFMKQEEELVTEWSVEPKRMQKAACRSKG